MLARKVRMAQGRGNRVCQNVTNRAQSRAQLPRSTIHSRRVLRTGLVQTSRRQMSLRKGDGLQEWAMRWAELRTAPPLGSYFREGDEFKRLRGDPRFVAR